VRVCGGGRRALRWVKHAHTHARTHVAAAPIASFSRGCPGGLALAQLPAHAHTLVTTALILCPPSPPFTLPVPHVDPPHAQCTRRPPTTCHTCHPLTHPIVITESLDLPIKDRLGFPMVLRSWEIPAVLIRGFTSSLMIRAVNGDRSCGRGFEPHIG
jgi:hypothetical protein